MGKEIAGMRTVCRIGMLLLGAPAVVYAAPCQITQLAEFKVSTDENRPLVDGEINGRPVKILIDTGASLSMMHSALAKQLDLKTETQESLRLYGVGGEKRVTMGRLRTLKFGNFILMNQEIAVVAPQKSSADENHSEIFVIGADLLSHYSVEFDLANHSMRLMKPENCKPEQLVYWSKTFSMADMDIGTVENPHIEASVMLNGKNIKALFDTGAPTSWSTVASARLAGVSNTAKNYQIEQFLTDANGAPIDSFLGSFSTISIGDDETVRKVKLWVADLFAADVQPETGSHLSKPVDMARMLIGCDFFLSHRIVAAFGQGKLLFTYNGGPVFQANGRSPKVTAPAAVPAPH